MKGKSLLLVAIYLISMMAIPVLAQDDSTIDSTREDGNYFDEPREIREEIRIETKINSDGREEERIRYRYEQRHDTDDKVREEVRYNSERELKPLKSSRRRASAARTATKHLNTKQLDFKKDSLEKHRESVEARRLTEPSGSTDGLEKGRTTDVDVESESKSKYRAKSRNDRREIRVEKRIITREKLDEARDRHKMAREKYVEVRERHRERKDKFHDARDRLRTCEADGEDCDEAREEISDRAKEYLMKAAERMLHKLEQVKERLSSSDSITNDQANDGVSVIDRSIAEVESVMADIEAATTKEELKEASKSLRKVWKAYERVVKMHSYRSVGRKVGLAVNKAQVMDEKLSCVVGSVDSPSSDLAMAVDTFGELVTDAADNFARAKNAWESEDQSMDSAKDAIKAGHESLKEAHKVLKRALPMVREEGGSFEGCRENQD